MKLNCFNLFCENSFKQEIRFNESLCLQSCSSNLNSLRGSKQVIEVSQSLLFSFNHGKDTEQKAHFLPNFRSNNAKIMHLCLENQYLLPKNTA